MKLHPQIELVLDELLPIVKVPFFIAGGSLVKFTTNSDIDIFFHSEEDYYKAIGNIPDTYKVITPCDSALLSSFGLIKTLIQLVGFNVGTMQEVINTFDLNKSMVAYDPYTKEFLIDPSFKLPLYIREGNVRKSTPARFIKYYETKIDSSEQSKVDIPRQIRTVLNSDDVLDYYKQELLVDLPKEELLSSFFECTEIAHVMLDTVDPEMVYKLCNRVFYGSYISYLYELLLRGNREVFKDKQKLLSVVKAFMEDQPYVIVNSYITSKNNNFKDPYSRIPLFKQEYPEIFL